MADTVNNDALIAEQKTHFSEPKVCLLPESSSVRMVSVIPAELRGGEVLPGSLIIHLTHDDPALRQRIATQLSEMLEGEVENATDNYIAFRPKREVVTKGDVHAALGLLFEMKAISPDDVMKAMGMLGIPSAQQREQNRSTPDLVILHGMGGC